MLITRGTTSQLLDSISFLHVVISDSVQWLPYLGFVPGPTRTTSKGLMSLLLSKIFEAESGALIFSLILPNVRFGFHQAMKTRRKCFSLVISQAAYGFYVPHRCANMHVYLFT